MNKVYRRILSIIISVAILASMMTGLAYAEGNLTDMETFVYNQETQTKVSKIEVSDTITLETTDYANGDSLINQLENGEVKYSVYINRTEGKVVTTEYEDGLKINETNETYIVHADVQPYEDEGGYAYLGAIEFRCRPISYSYEVNRLMHIKYGVLHDRFSNYNVYGEYSSIATLGGVIALVLSVPAYVAGKVATWAVWSLGAVTTGAGIYFNESHLLHCSETTYYWRLWDNDNTSKYCQFSGTRYRITEPTSGPTEYYDGIFHIPASYGNRDEDFALELFGYLYGTVHDLQVTRWIPA